MFSLTENLEETIFINSEEYEVDLSFNTVLSFYELLEDQELESYEKIILAFRLFLPQEDPQTFTFEQKYEAIEGIREYIQATPYGNSEEDTEEEEENADKPSKSFSYSQDAGAIYASFMMDYGIDLLKEKGRMHFLTFKALLEGLSDKTYFQRIISLRNEPLTGKEGDSLTKLVDAKDYFALDDNQTVDQLDDQMGSVFDMLKNKAQNE